jgi:hypothetical protein
VLRGAIAQIKRVQQGQAKAGQPNIVGQLILQPVAAG